MYDRKLHQTIGYEKSSKQERTSFNKFATNFKNIADLILHPGIN